MGFGKRVLVGLAHSIAGVVVFVGEVFLIASVPVFSHMSLLGVLVLLFSPLFFYSLWRKTMSIKTLLVSGFFVSLWIVVPICGVTSYFFVTFPVDEFSTGIFSPAEFWQFFPGLFLLFFIFAYLNFFVGGGIRLFFLRREKL